MRFLETVFRHRIIAILPIVLGLVLACGYELAQPRAYSTSASLWINSNVPGNQQTTNQYVDPSTQQQSILRELLTTRTFALAVGHNGPLAGYLSGHPHSDVKGLAALPGIGALFGATGKTLDDRIASDLPTDVTISAPGPQVVTITVQQPSASVAAGTTSEVIKQYQNQVIAAIKANDQVSVNYYGTLVAQGQRTLQDAEQALTQYLDTHRNVPANGAGDPTATQLVQSADLAQRDYDTQLQQYQQSKLNLANAGNQSGFQVIDGPITPSAPVSRVKQLLGAGIAGLLVGIVVSLLIISAMTAMDRAVRRPSDLKRLGLDTTAGISQFRNDGRGLDVNAGIRQLRGDPLSGGT